MNNSNESVSQQQISVSRRTDQPASGRVLSAELSLFRAVCSRNYEKDRNGGHARVHYANGTQASTRRDVFRVASLWKITRASVYQKLDLRLVQMLSLGRKHWLTLQKMQISRDTDWLFQIVKDDSNGTEHRGQKSGSSVSVIVLDMSHNLCWSFVSLSGCFVRKS